MLRTTTYFTIEMMNLIDRGFHIFPLQKNSKIPIQGFKWKEESTNDKRVIDHWAQIYPDCNWAIDCGKSGLTVIDCDVSEDANGADNLQEVSQDKSLDKTMVVETPSSGRHLYYQGVTRNTASKIADKVDTRSEGGYVVAPPSIIEGNDYHIIQEYKIAELPKWLEEKISAKREKSEDAQTPAIELDQPQNISDAIAYLQTAQPSIEGLAGDDTSYRIACRTRDFGVSEDTAVDLMIRFWNDRCQPPWELNELQTKVGNAYRYAVTQAGSGTAEADFEPLEENIADRPKLIAEFKGTPPEREWIVPNWLPTGELSSLYGDGGVGKSLLALQLALSVASGTVFFGTDITQQMPVLVVMAEDSDDEIHRRITAIQSAPDYAFMMDDIPLYLWSRVGKDAILANIGRKDAAITITAFGRRLEYELGKMPAGRKLLILDTLADIYGGDENDRASVNRFVKVVLGAMVKKYDVTILFLAHPSKSSMTDGSYYSGSSAWNNSVRNRLGLRPHDIEELSNLRILERLKSNYAATGESISMEWAHGSFKALVENDNITDQHDELNCNIIREAIRVQSETGTPFSKYPSGALYLYAAGIKGHTGEEIRRHEMTRYLNQLIREGRVELVSGQSRGNGLFPAHGKREFNANDL